MELGPRPFQAESISVYRKQKVRQQIRTIFRGSETNRCKAEINENRHVRRGEQNIGRFDVVVGDEVVVEKGGGREKASEVGFGLFLRRDTNGQTNLDGRG